MTLYPPLCRGFLLLLFLHNTSLEIKYQGVYFRLTRRSDCIFIRGWEGSWPLYDVTWNQISRCLFSSLNIYREGAQTGYQWPSGWEKNQPVGVMKAPDLPGVCHVTLESIVMVSGWHRCSWHRYQDASDTRTKTRPTRTPWLSSGWEEGHGGQKIWKNKRNQPQQSSISSTKELLWDF